MDRDKKSMSKSISIWVNFMLNARRFCYICLSTPPFCKIPTHHTFLTIYCWFSAPFNHFSHFRLCTMTSFLSRHMYCSHWWCVKNSSRPGWILALCSLFGCLALCRRNRHTTLSQFVWSNSFPLNERLFSGVFSTKVLFQVEVGQGHASHQWKCHSNWTSGLVRFDAAGSASRWRDGPNSKMSR